MALRDSLVWPDPRLKQKGKPVPENDIWIAAICMQHRIPLGTADAHFAEFTELQVIAP